jgi:hypothetical protein
MPKAASSAGGMVLAGRHRHRFIWDKQRNRFFLLHREHERDYFFSTKAARNWLQKTTVKWHRTRAVEEALDDVA